MVSVLAYEIKRMKAGEQHAAAKHYTSPDAFMVPPNDDEVNAVLAQVSKLFRNVPIVNLLEMSPFCVVVFSLECARKRSPVVREKRKCVFQRAALRSLGWKTMASSSANPGATDGLS